MSSTLFISKTGSFQKLALKKEGQLDQFQAVLPWRQNTVGRIYAAKILDIDKGLNAVFLQVESDQEGFLRLQSRGPGAVQGASFKRGQGIIVQVQKAQAPGKRLPCSLDIGLAGFHMIYSPDGNRVRFSRRFSGEKKEMSNLLKGARIHEGGWLFRSSAAQTSHIALERECRYLLERWSSITDAFSTSSSPRVLDDQDSNPLRRMLADSLSQGLENIYVDDEDSFEEIMGWAKHRIPFLCDRLFMHQGSCSLFATYGMDSGFSDLSQSRVWLKTGGYLLFNQTEAVTVIDVNSGKAKLGEGKKLTLNIQAAVEAARHIKLREIGGIIVIDFVNMSTVDANRQVETAFRREMGSGLTQCKLEPINGLGLLCLSRRRRLTGAWETHTETCPKCRGTGYMVHKDLLMLELLSKIKGEIEMEPESSLRIVLSKEMYQQVVQVSFEKYLPESWKVQFVCGNHVGSKGFQVFLE